MQRDPQFQLFEVIPLTGALGAEVRGVRLSGDAGKGLFDDLRRALDHYHVLAVIVLFAMLVLMAIALDGHKPLPGGY